MSRRCPYCGTQRGFLARGPSMALQSGTVNLKVARARFALVKARNNYEATRSVAYADALAKACRRLIRAEVWDADKRHSDILDEVGKVR